MRLHFFLCLLATCFCLVLFGQAPSVIWSKTYGGPNGDYAWSIVPTSDGGYVVAGYVESAGGDITGYHGNTAVNDIWVTKIDVNGKIQWKRCLGGLSLEMGGFIRQIADGGYILFAESASDKCNTNGINGGQFWLVKLAPNGDVQWQKKYGGSRNEYAFAMDLTPDGGYILAGSTESMDGDVTGNHGYFDWWVTKVDAAGNLQWQKSLGGTQEDQAFAIKSTPDGNYIVAGITKSGDGDVTGYHGGMDAWIVKLNNTGNLVWQKCLGGTGGETARSIAMTSDGNYMIGASSSSNDGDVASAKGAEDFWFVKMNPSGNIIWQKTYGGSRNEELFDIKQTSDGGYVAVGTSESFDKDLNCNAGVRDMWIIKTAADGTLQWQKNMGGELQDEAYAVQPLNDGNYILCGMTCSRAIPGFHIPTLQNTCADYWVVKLSPGGVAPPPPSIIIDANTTTACSGMPNRIKATAIHAGIAPSFQWKRNGVSVGTNQPFYDASDFIDNETISCTITSGGPCETGGVQAIANATIRINTNVASPTIVITTPTPVICICGIAIFHAAVGNGGTSPNYEWKINGQPAGDNLPDFTSDNISPFDQVTCTYTDNSICIPGGSVISNSIMITTGDNIPPTLSISSPTHTICSGSTLSFTGVPANAMDPHFQWQVNGVNMGSDSTGFTGFNLADGDQVTCFITSYAGSQCFAPGNSQSNVIKVTVNPNIDPVASINSSANPFCEGKTTSFNAIATNAGTNPSYQWQVNGANVGGNSSQFTGSSFNNNDMILCVVTPGIGACVSSPVTSNTITATLKPSPVVNLSPSDTTVFMGTSIQLSTSVSGNIDHFTWSPSIQLQNPASLNPITIELKDDVDFILSLENEFGCVSTARANIQIKSTNLFIPNAFTPNNDGLNDIFKIPPKADLTLKEFSIYDRWGKRIFFTTDRLAGWNGKVNGAPSPTGVYVYTISGSNRTGPLYVKGTVTLVR